MFSFRNELLKCIFGLSDGEEGEDFEVILQILELRINHNLAKYKIQIVTKN